MNTNRGILPEVWGISEAEIQQEIALYEKTELGKTKTESQLRYLAINYLIRKKAHEMRSDYPRPHPSE